MCVCVGTGFLLIMMTCAMQMNRTAMGQGFHTFTVRMMMACPTLPLRQQVVHISDATQAWGYLKAGDS